MDSRVTYAILLAFQILFALLATIFAATGVVGSALLCIGFSITLIPVTGHVRMRRLFTALKNVSERRNSAVGRQVAVSLKDMDQQLLNSIESLRSQLSSELGHSRSGAGINESDISRFDPHVVSATEVKSKPSSQFAGRLAADQIMAEDSTSKLRFILEGGMSRSSRNIAVLGTKETRQALTSLGRIHQVFPAQRQESLPPGTSYFVIDEAAFKGGAWAGADSAQQSSVMLNLIDSIKKEKKDGVIIILVSRNRASHYSATIRDLSDIVVSNGQGNLQWEADVHLPVLNSLISLSERADN